MQTISEINQDIEGAQSLKLLTQVYTNLAANKLNTIREYIQRNIAFGEELAFVFSIVKKSVKEKLEVGSRKTNITLIITSNSRFYGNLERDLMALFSEDPSSDKLIIGKTGKEYFKARGIFADKNFLILKKDLPTTEELNYVVESTRKYQNILVYYSHFKSVLVQKPAVSNITLSNMNLRFADLPPAGYIFEPEIENIVRFFESQIMRILIEQTFLESELARTANRLISMNQAQYNAETYLKQEKQLLHKAKNSLVNARILEMTNAFYQMELHV